MPYEKATSRLEALGIHGENAEQFWLTVRGNLERFNDAAHWWQIINADLPENPELSEEDRAFVRESSTMLPTEPWDKQTWKIWTDAVKAATGRKGKTLFMPLRLALTGQAHGPELADLLVLIGPDRTKSRLL
ncbi:Glutamate--tRNA ligase [compost metagenome]